MEEVKTKFVLGVDLDGVVVDFYNGLRPIAAEWLGVSEDSLPRDVTYGLPEWRLDKVSNYEDLHRFAVTQRDLFKILKPMAGAPAGLRQLSNAGIRIRIITHRLFIKYFHEEAVSQTTRAVQCSLHKASYRLLRPLEEGHCVVVEDLSVQHSRSASCPR